MKRSLIILTLLVAAIAFTFLGVTRHLAIERASRLDKALMDAEDRIVQLESSIAELEGRVGAMAGSRAAAEPGAREARPDTAPTASVSSGGGVEGQPEQAVQPAVAVAVPGEAVRLIRFVPGTGTGTTNFVRIEGTSSIHPWQVESRLLGGMAEAEPVAGLLSGGDIAGRMIQAKVNCFIPVRSLRSLAEDGSPYSSTMDEIMYGKLKADSHGRIFYSLTSLTARERPTDRPGALICEAQGKLAVAGKTNDVTMLVTVIPQGDRRVQFKGACTVKMTDFDITPPSPSLAGVSIKTGDEVNLKFVWNVESR